MNFEQKLGIGLGVGAAVTGSGIGATIEILDPDVLPGDTLFAALEGGVAGALIMLIAYLTRDWRIGGE